MHIPDGFLSPPVWAAFDVLAVPAVGWVVRGDARRAGPRMDDRNLPLLGVMGAFVFAAQMINFPVGIGTSGHLVGGTLLAIVLGPAPAAMVMTAILAIQALVFQDGGIIALGANVFNMAVVGVIAGYLPYRYLQSRRSAAIFIGGVVSVLSSAILALAELLASGVAMQRRVLFVSLALFLASAVIEGAITLAAVRAIERMNPAFVGGSRESGSRVIGAVAVVAVALALGGILIASRDPDGIERLASAHAPSWLNSPLADYRVPAIDSPWLRRAGAGIAGIVLVFGACFGLGKLANRKKDR